jgi:hypothetical protein
MSGLGDLAAQVEAVFALHSDDNRYEDPEAEQRLPWWARPVTDQDWVTLAEQNEQDD